MRTYRFPMKLAQKGFTLIELIIVIVIVGILAAVAIPTYTNLTGEANLAVAKAEAGAIASATAINNSLASASLAGKTAVTTCAAAAGLVNGLTGTVGGSAPSCTITVGTGTSAGVGSWSM